MSDYSLPVKYAYTHVDHGGGDKSDSVRVLSNSPETLTLQIRTFGPVNGKLGPHKGKYRPAFSTVSLTPAEVDWLLMALIKARNDIPSARLVARLTHIRKRKPKASK